MTTQPINKNTSRIALVLLCALALAAFDAQAVNQALVNRPRDGSRTDSVHRIPLLDVDGNRISGADVRPEPFSTRQTCGECHNYEKISHGWHFNAATTQSLSGRAGEPWILSDPFTNTQLPMSLHTWKGTWQPGQIGMTPWGFAKAFGTHMPGGGITDVDPDSTETMTADARWYLSGALEINCLGCHAGSRLQDQTEWATQVSKQNFKWAATAASMASVSRSVKELPDFYDAIARPSDPDDPKKGMPSVHYNTVFDDKSRVLIDIKGRPDNNRCYFCHSAAHSGQTPYMTDQDVHIQAGLLCVDCHRNDINHGITRGAEGDSAMKANPEAVELTCRGCHLGDGKTQGGRLRAPRPEHKGLPPQHLEKLSCTACHAGPMPGAKAGEVKTARANKLGAVRMGEEPAVPEIASPVFVKQDDGVIRPCNVLWPAFWGLMKDGKVTPLLPEKVSAVAEPILLARVNNTTGTEFNLTEAKTVAALVALKNAKLGDGTPVYISGGKVRLLAPEEGKLAELEGENEAAKLYAWPVAHDVRPAAQALGAKGCTECHNPDSAFLFGTVQVVNPLQDGRKVTMQMAELEGQNAETAKMFGSSFAFRPWFKLFGFAASALVLGVLLSYGLAGLGGLCRTIGRRD